MSTFPTRIELDPESFPALKTNPRTDRPWSGIPPNLVQLQRSTQILVIFHPEFSGEWRRRNNESKLLVLNNAPDPGSFQNVLQQGQFGAFFDWQTKYSLHNGSFNLDATSTSRTYAITCQYSLMGYEFGRVVQPRLQPTLLDVVSA
jgi:hypothetical protein